MQLLTFWLSDLCSSEQFSLITIAQRERFSTYLCACVIISARCAKSERATGGGTSLLLSVFVQLSHWHGVVALVCYLSVDVGVRKPSVFLLDNVHVGLLRSWDWMRNTILVTVCQPICWTTPAPIVPVYKILA